MGKNINDHGQLNLSVKLFSAFPIMMVILEPYALNEGGISICVFLVIGMFVLLASLKTIIVYKPLLTLLIIDLFLTLFSFIFTNSMETNLFLALKIFAVFVLYLVVYSGVWNCEIKYAFFNIAKWVGLICAVLAIFQFVFSSAGINFYDGKLPLPIGKNSNFGGLLDKNTGDVRVHSFFEEPSYLALFEIPITIHLVQEKEYVKACVCGISCILSGSMIGVIGLFISLVLLLLLDSSIHWNTKFGVVVALIFIIGILMYIYIYNNSFNDLVDYYLKRFSNYEKNRQRDDSSFSQRLIGNISLFNNYNTFNKTVGVGFNQYPLYFHLSKDYSNDFVSTLLNFGWLGVAALVMVLISLFKKSSGKSIVFMLIFIMLLAIDHSWFGAMFFYMLTWVITKSNSRHLNFFLKFEC